VGGTLKEIAPRVAQSDGLAHGRADPGPGANSGGFAHCGALHNETGLSIILVEQNSRVALSFSPRTVILDKGRIVYDGESEPLQ
jgi:hypothetical protein